MDVQAKNIGIKFIYVVNKIIYLRNVIQQLFSFDFQLLTNNINVI